MKNKKNILLIAILSFLLAGCSEDIKTIKKIETIEEIQQIDDLIDEEILNSNDVITKKPDIIEENEIETAQIYNIDNQTPEVEHEVTITPSVSIVDLILLDNKILGNYGRLYFSNLCSVGLNYTSLDGDSSFTQSVVDNKDSAAIFNFKNSVVIADHSNQEFSELKKTQVGDTVYIKYLDSTLDSYTCTEISNGKNTGHELVMSDGRNISEIPDCDIVMYTCNGDWHNVIITLWKKDNELNKILIKKNI